MARSKSTSLDEKVESNAEYMEGAAARLELAVQRGADFVIGERPLTSAESAVIRENTAAAVIEAVSEAIAQDSDTMIAAASGEIGVIAEIVPKVGRQREEIRIRIGRLLTVTTLYLPVHSPDGWLRAIVDGRRLILRKRAHLKGKDGMLIDTVQADANGGLNLRGGTPGEEYLVIRSPDGVLMLQPLSDAQEY